MKKTIFIIFGILILVVSFFEIRYRINKTREDAASWWGGVTREFQDAKEGKINTKSIASIKDLYDELLGFKEEKKFIILLQNSMELRPTGGFISSFLEVTVEKGKVTNQTLTDTGVFDKSINSTHSHPVIYNDYAPTKYLGTKDSNYFFDFKTSAKKFLEIYSLGKDQNEIEGVIGITSNILPDMLEYTGPITLEGVEGEFTKDNVLEKLEWEVEVGYSQKGIEAKDRKNVMQELIKKILEEIENTGGIKKLMLLAKFKEELESGKITIYTKNEAIQQKLEELDWAGRIEKTNKDYLAVIDSNLWALKTNRCIEKNIKYLRDFTDLPKIKVEIEYVNNCKQKDFMTTNYRGIASLYIPQEYELIETVGFQDEITISQEEDKKILSSIVNIPLGGKKVYNVSYTPTNNLEFSNYELYFQHQNGVKEIDLEVRIKKGEEEKTIYNGVVEKDIKISN